MEAKVRKHPMFAGSPPQAVLAAAASLSDPSQVMEKFEHLLDIEACENNIREGDDCELTHSLEFNKLKDQQKKEAAIVASLPVKLTLSKLKRVIPPAAAPFTALLRFAFGPLHASLVIGNICVEWDDGSLIVPLPVSDIPGDFQARLDQEASWQGGVGQAVKAMSMANRNHLDTPVKLSILSDSRDNKRRLLEGLCELIVRYNVHKKYSLFRCNCQHFVKDALRVLRIPVEDTPKFEGSLGNYFDDLKRGKDIRSQFDSHADLDAYVKGAMGSLEIRDKEYLLCLYFQFHSSETRELAPEEQEVWRCSIKSCQSEQLEVKIEDESLLLHHLAAVPSWPRPRAQAQAGVPVATRHISTTPTVPSVQEVVEVETVGNPETDGIPETEGTPETAEADPVAAVQDHLGTSSVEQQVSKISQYSGYSKKVLTKLKAHPKFQTQSDPKLQEMTDVLSERRMFGRRYFGAYLDEKTQDIFLETSSDSAQDNPMSQNELKRRASDRFDALFNFDMHLIIRATTNLKTPAAKAPVAIGLQLGSYVFEWNEWSLVIPVESSQVESEPVLLSPVHPESKWFNIVEEDRESIGQSIRKTDYSMQIGLQYEIARKKDQLLYAFIDTVMLYNRDKEYGGWTCTNEHFLTDAMNSLGISQRPKLSKSIQKHIAQLKPSKKISRKQVRNHEELDGVAASEVIDVKEEGASRGDIEYLIAQYFLFHVSGWEGDRDRGESSPANKWECSFPGCKLRLLEQTLARRTSFSSTTVN